VRANFRLQDFNSGLAYSRLQFCNMHPESAMPLSTARRTDADVVRFDVRPSMIVEKKERIVKRPEPPE